MKQPHEKPPTRGVSFFKKSQTLRTTLWFSLFGDQQKRLFSFQVLFPTCRSKKSSAACLSKSPRSSLFLVGRTPRQKVGRLLWVRYGKSDRFQPKVQVRRSKQIARHFLHLKHTGASVVVEGTEAIQQSNVASCHKRTKSVVVLHYLSVEGRAINTQAMITLHLA